jgi:DMSO reductase anchor subunit
MREMGFRIARKHAAKLRRLALLLGAAVPAVLTLALLFALSGWAGALIALAAAISASAGVLIERWLFFAEARHTVTLYYGAQAA